MALTLPRYWARAEGTLAGPAGRTYPVSVWGWSTESEAHAQAHAAARLSRARERAAAATEAGVRGGYYEAAALREPILDTITRADGSVLAAVTRNRHGVRVMNTDRVMFVDIDLPRAKDGAGAFAALFRLLFRPGPAGPQPRGEVSAAERAALDRIGAALATRADWAVRVYRTPKGLRLLVTHDCFAPDAEAAHGFMREVGADPWYVKLCRSRACFRARLGAKPERIKVASLLATYPAPDAAAQADYDRWVADYESVAKGFAACTMLRSIGTGVVHPEAAIVIDAHDRACRAGSNLPLA